MEGYDDPYAPGMPISPTPMPGAKSDEIYSAIIQEKRMENILEQVNPERLIIEIEFRLKGYKKNQFSRQWELIGNREKPVSEELIQDFLSIISSQLTNNTTLSNYTPDEINKLMETLIRSMIDMIREKADIYGLLDDYAERDRIMIICLGSVFSALKRAQGGLESKRIFDSTQIRDQFMPQQDKGFLRRMFNV